MKQRLAPTLGTSLVKVFTGKRVFFYGKFRSNEVDFLTGIDTSLTI